MVAECTLADFTLYETDPTVPTLEEGTCKTCIYACTEDDALLKKACELKCFP
jgi:hypothetical protein